MGTEFKLVIYTESEASARRASRAAFDRVASLDATFSDYKLDSELMRLCEQAGGPPVSVSDDLFDVLRMAKEMAERTGGAFDPTIKPVVKLWRRARRQQALPDPDLLIEARALVGADRLILDERARTVRLLTPGMQLDLGGIAKGYAADEALDTLREQGSGSALVAAAGDIVAGDPPPGERGWRVGIAPLDDPEGSPDLILELTHAAISTSGDSSQYVIIDGTRYSHIVDPKTGVGLVNRSIVTVVAPRGALADSLATSISVLGPREGLQLAASYPGVSVRIVRETDTGQREVVESESWRQLPFVEPSQAISPPELTR